MITRLSHEQIATICAKGEQFFEEASGDQFSVRAVCQFIDDMIDVVEAGFQDARLRADAPNPRRHYYAHHFMAYGAGFLKFIETEKLIDEQTQKTLISALGCLADYAEHAEKYDLMIDCANAAVVLNLADKIGEQIKYWTIAGSLRSDDNEQSE